VLVDNGLPLKSGRLAAPWFSDRCRMRLRGQHPDQCSRPIAESQSTCCIHGFGTLAALGVPDRLDTSGHLLANANRFACRRRPELILGGIRLCLLDDSFLHTDRNRFAMLLGDTDPFHMHFFLEK